MKKSDYLIVTDRGGHLSNALQLMKQMGHPPRAIITTYGPDIEALKKENTPLFFIPYLFSWLGKKRFLNPIGMFLHGVRSFLLAYRLKPNFVISLGATNVVFFCYFAKLFGAQIIHVECMNQVQNPSITGKLLYPIAREVLVQWKELLTFYGKKARYEGWVLS